MPIGKSATAEDQRRRRRTAEKRCQGCGLHRAEKYHRVNPATPGLSLRQDCAEVLNLVRIIKDLSGGRAAGLADTLGRVKDAIAEKPEKYCAKCIDAGRHLTFAPLMSWCARPGEGQICPNPAAPPSKTPIAARCDAARHSLRPDGTGIATQQTLPNCGGPL